MKIVSAGGGRAVTLLRRWPYYVSYTVKIKI